MNAPAGAWGDQHLAIDRENGGQRGVIIPWQRTERRAGAGIIKDDREIRVVRRQELAVRRKAGWRPAATRFAESAHPPARGYLVYGSSLFARGNRHELALGGD